MLSALTRIHSLVVDQDSHETRTRLARSGERELPASQGRQQPYGNRPPFAQFPSADGLAQLVKEIGLFEGAHLSFEATGGCDVRLSEPLRGAKLTFTRAHPRQMRDVVKALSCLAKTDRIGAALLTEFGLAAQAAAFDFARPRQPQAAAC